MTKRLDVIIVGGGIAGLAAAWELRASGLSIRLLEAGAQPGGVILTESVDGFTYDAGPDALLIQKPAAIALCRELGLGDRLFPTLLPRTASILRGGRLIPLPEASVLGIPTSVMPMVTTPLFSWPGKVRMGMELFIPPRRDTTDESIGGWMTRRFGREAALYLAEPLLAGIHAGDVDRLSMQALFPRMLEAEQRRGSVIRAFRAMQGHASPDGAFLSLPNGIAEIVQALTAQLPADTIECGVPIQRIEGRGPFTVHAANRPFETRSVIVSTPAYVTEPLLEPVDPELARLCGQTRYSSTVTVALGYRREQVRDPLRGSGFVVPRVERQTLMAGSFVSSKWPSRAPEGHVLLRGFIGGAGDPAKLERDDAELGSLTHAEFARLLGISGAPLFTRIYRWPRTTAQHEVGHPDRMAEIDRRLTAYPALAVTGSGFRGAGIPDCVADARAQAAQLRDRLARG